MTWLTPQISCRTPASLALAGALVAASALRDGEKECHFALPHDIERGRHFRAAVTRRKPDCVIFILASAGPLETFLLAAI